MFLFLSLKAVIKLMVHLTTNGVLESEKCDHNCQRYSKLKDSGGQPACPNVLSPRSQCFQRWSSVTRRATKAAHPYPEAQN